MNTKKTLNGAAMLTRGRTHLRAIKTVAASPTTSPASKTTLQQAIVMQGDLTARLGKMLGVTPAAELGRAPARRRPDPWGRHPRIFAISYSEPLAKFLAVLKDCWTICPRLVRDLSRLKPGFDSP